MNPTQQEWVEPMKASLTYAYFSDPAWIYEPKLDGIRCLALKYKETVRLLTRNRLPLNDRFPALVEPLKEQGHDFIVDGEIAALAGGRTSFSMLQQAGRQDIAVAYFIFDLIALDGADLRNKPLLERKELLSGIMTWRKPLHLVEHIRKDGEAYYRAACEQGLEGVIAKRAASTYSGIRSQDWLKFKCSNQQEFVIGGFTDPQGTRVGFGALLMGYYEDDAFRYAGKVGTGYNTSTLVELRKKLDDLEIDEPPFVESGMRRRRGAHWVRPQLVAQVAFSEWTSDGRLRHPRFIGLRHDKPAREVAREQPG